MLSRYSWWLELNFFLMKLVYNSNTKGRFSGAYLRKFQKLNQSHRTQNKLIFWKFQSNLPKAMFSVPVTSFLPFGNFLKYAPKNLPLREIQLQPPGEPGEHRLGEVLQERSKSKFNIILSYSFIVFVYLRIYFSLKFFLWYLSSSGI